MAQGEWLRVLADADGDVKEMYAIVWLDEEVEPRVMFNPNHDEKGQFSEGSGGSAGSATRDKSRDWLAREDPPFVDMGDKDREWAQQFVHGSLEKFADNLQTLGRAVGSGADGSRVSVEPADAWHSVMQVTIESKDSDRVVQFWLNKDGGAELVGVPFKSPASAKVTRESLRQTLKTIDDAGATSLRVHAGLEDGGYLWARLGFHADSGEASALYREMTQRSGRSLPFDVRNAVKQITDEHRSDMMQQLADLRVGSMTGRQLLRNTNWHGSVNLDDPEFRKRVGHFLGER